MSTVKFACDIRYEETKIKLTPQRAREFLELDELPGERAKRDYHVDTLRACDVDEGGAWPTNLPNQRTAHV